MHGGAGHGEAPSPSEARDDPPTAEPGDPEGAEGPERGGAVHERLRPRLRRGAREGPPALPRARLRHPAPGLPCEREPVSAKGVDVKILAIDPGPSVSAL